MPTLATTIRPAGSGYGTTLDITADGHVVQQITSWDTAHLRAIADHVTAAAAGVDAGDTHAEQSAVAHGLLDAAAAALAPEGTCWDGDRAEYVPLKTRSARRTGRRR